MDKALIIATGPSINSKVINTCHKLKALGFKLFGCNLTYKYLNLDVFHACNKEFYEFYWEDGLKDTPADKWTIDRDIATKYGVNFIGGVWKDGLSEDPNLIHYHHGSGPQLINIAYHYGIKTMYLVGWDMKYPGKLGHKEYTGDRHFFGEYPKELQHWPKTGGNGELEGLIKEVETIIPEDYGIEIFNTTLGSALTCFPFKRLGDL